MRTNHPLTILFTITMAALACAAERDPGAADASSPPDLAPSTQDTAADKPAPNPAESKKLAESRATWDALKGAMGPDYRYTTLKILFGSGRLETTVEVRGDRVVRRSFTGKDRAGNDLGDWMEEGTELGRQDEGHPPRRLEDVYDACAVEVLTKSPAQNHITLGFRANGLLEVCMYRPKNCVDECDEGVHISKLELLD